MTLEARVGGTTSLVEQYFYYEIRVLLHGSWPLSNYLTIYIVNRPSFLLC